MENMAQSGWPRQIPPQNGMSNDGQNFIGMPQIGMPGPANPAFINNGGGPPMMPQYVFKCPECSLQKHSIEDLEVKYLNFTISNYF